MPLPPLRRTSVAVGLVFAIGCGGYVWENYDFPVPPRRITTVIIVQDGVADTIRTLNSSVGYAPVDPDLPFDLIWVADGERGVMSVSVETTGGNGYLAFENPAGCGVKYGARVSPLTAGWYWSIRLRYDNIPEESTGPNPCPQITGYANNYTFSWTADLTSLSRPVAEPRPVTITRLTQP